MIEALLAQGLALHQAGRLAEAEPFYRRALLAAPDHPDALHMLGVLAHQAGRQTEAMQLLQRAAARAPQAAALQNSLGNVLRAQGQAAAAAACYRRALALAPNEASFAHHLGLAQHESGDAGAVATLRRAIRLAPDLIAARIDLARVLVEAGKPHEAASVAEAAIRRAPGSAPARNALGLALSAQGNHAAALAAFDGALAIDAGHPSAAANRAAALLALDRLEDAAAAYAALPPDAALLVTLGQIRLRLKQGAAAEQALRAALALAPDDAAAHHWLGRALAMQDRFREALAALREAEIRAPDDAAVQHDIGMALRDLARWPDALAPFRAAAARAPDNPEYRSSLAYALLANGLWEEGWREFEWRTAKPGNARLATPRWDGAPTDRVVLIHAEQGLGDTLQFCRFVADAAARAPIVFAAPRALRPLLRDFVPDVAVFDADPLPDHALHLPLMSLPRVLGIGPEQWGARVPYVRAGDEAIARWRTRLAALPRPRAGVVWAGNPAYPADRRRSMPSEAIAPLLCGAAIGWVSLQVGGAGAALARVAPAVFDAAPHLADFTETAALVAALDLVVAVDTAVAHLAGAMGREVWLLNRADTDWRWLIGRADSPWYPTMRIFRQPSPGDWASVITAVETALAARAC